MLPEWTLCHRYLFFPSSLFYSILQGGKQWKRKPVVVPGFLSNQQTEAGGVGQQSEMVVLSVGWLFKVVAKGVFWDRGMKNGGWWLEQVVFFDSYN